MVLSYRQVNPSSGWMMQQLPASTPAWAGASLAEIGRTCPLRGHLPLQPTLHQPVPARADAFFSRADWTAIPFFDHPDPAMLAHGRSKNLIEQVSSLSILGRLLLQTQIPPCVGTLVRAGSSDQGHTGFIIELGRIKSATHGRHAVLEAHSPVHVPSANRDLTSAAPSSRTDQFIPHMFPDLVSQLHGSSPFQRTGDQFLSSYCCIRRHETTETIR
jgi:hypothetical protein